MLRGGKDTFQKSNNKTETATLLKKVTTKKEKDIAIDAFKNDIGDEFNVFNNISSDNKLLVTLYDRYKRCVEAGGDDCLDVAIGTIRDFFEKVKQDVGDDISEEDLFDMYEDYFLEQEELEYYEEKYNEWMSDQDKQDAIEVKEDQEQDQEEEEADKDEQFQIEAPSPEEDENIEEEREEYAEAYEDKVGDITDKDVPLPGSYENYLIFQSEGFIYSYDGKELYWNDLALQNYYSDFYDYLVSDGVRSDKTDSYLLQDGNTGALIQPIGIEGEEATNFLLSYYYTILSAYASDTEIVISDSAEQTTIWSEDFSDEQNDMLNLLWNYYQNGNIESVKSIITLEQFADDILNTIQGLDSSNEYEVSEGFYEDMAYVQYIMEDLNEDASYSDVFGYMVENYDKLDQSKTTFDSVINYYEETGDYIYDDKTDTLMTTDDFNETYDIKYTAIDTPDVNIDDAIAQTSEGIDQTAYVNNPNDSSGTRNAVLNSVNVDSSGNITYFIDTDILSRLYPDLYESLDIPDNGEWTGDEADNFFTFLFYAMYQSYLVDGDYQDAYGDSYDFFNNKYTYGLSDEGKQYLDEIVNWYEIYGNFDDITTSTDYAEMVYYLSQYADMNTSDAERGEYVLQDDGTYEIEGSDGLADGWVSTFNLYNYVAYYFGEVYENYTTDDVLNYISDNGYDVNADELLDGIVEYYTDLGYTQDEDGKVYSPEEKEDAEQQVEDTEQLLEVAETAVGEPEYLVDTTSEEYLEFVEKMGDKLGDQIRNILEDDLTGEFLQSLYKLYVERDVSELKNYNQFAEAVDDLTGNLVQALGDLGYTYTEDTAQIDLNNYVLDYINEYGYEFSADNVMLDEEGLPALSSVEVQEDIAEDTAETFENVDGYYYTLNKDGSYDVYEIKNGIMVGQAESFSDDSFMTAFGDIEFNELTDEVLKQVTEYSDDVDEEDVKDNVEETEKTTTEKEVIEEGEVGNHITDVNNSINNFQITENMGRIELNQKKPIFRNSNAPQKAITLAVGEGKRGTDNVLMGVNYDGSSRVSHIPDEHQLEYQTEGGNKILRLDGSNRKLTREEWRIIEESYLYDKDISKPFIVDKLSQESLDKETASDIAFSVNYNNVFEYYFELSNKNRNFFVWLDSYKAGEEGRSYVNYRVNSKLEANNVDINDYMKRGSILDLLPSIDFTPHFNNQGSQAQEKAILETHSLGIEDVNAFILVGSLCSLFSNIIMENAKHIGKNSIVQNIESNISKGEYEGLRDNIYTGLYKSGSQIGLSINQSSLSDAQKNVLNAIFSERSFKSIADYEINNRYGEIIFKFFGTNDERKHKLENNSGRVIFELGLILLSYYASMMDNDELMGIDTNERSNLIKITSEFLETLYPSQVYDQNLLTAIDNIMKLYTREIRNLKRGTVANEITAEDLLRDVIRDMIEIAFNETPTTFNVYDFFDKRLLGHISNNFGLDMYMKIGTFDDMIDFIADGFLDSQQFNKMIKFVMTSTMGERFSFKGNEMLETLFMSSVQAQTFINSSKFNLLIPVIHPEIIDLVPPEKVNINLWGFNAKIVGFVQYNKKTPIYDTAIQDDINMRTSIPKREPEFITEEDAEKRAGILGIIGTHQHEDGTYMAGESHEQLQEHYDNLEVNNSDFDIAVKNLKERKEPLQIADTEHRIMVEDEEDIQEIGETYEMGEEIQDYKLAGILEILNTFDKSKYKKGVEGESPLEKALKDVITDFDNIEVIEPSEGDNYVIIKDGNNVYVAFRGSKGFFEYEDWYGETGNLVNMDTKSFYSMATAGIGQNHQGFKRGYDKMKTEILDTLNDKLDKDSNLYIIGHSRGTAFGDQLVEDAIRIHPKDKIKYRGFGYITHRNKESAEQMNKKIEGMDYQTYHIAGDFLRLLTKSLPYYPVGKNKIITGYETAFTGSPFMTTDINALAEIKEDTDSFGKTFMNDIWRIARTPLMSQHFISGYKNLLAQDKHEFKFRKLQDKTYNTAFTGAVGMAVLYGGRKLYKLATELSQTKDLKADELNDVIENIIAGREAVVRDEMREEFEEETQGLLDRINELEEMIDDDESSSYMSEEVSSEDVPPDMMMERGGKVDDGKVDKVKVESYEYGGKVADYECEKIDGGTKAMPLAVGKGERGIETDVPSFEYGGKVEPKTEIEETFEKSLDKTGVEGEIVPSYVEKYAEGGKVPDNVVNPALYKKAKAKYANMKHSAYKSSLVVKAYKKMGGKYRGKKTKKGLTQWHREQWRNQRGEEGYKKKGDIYRPTKRISKDTPTTMGELSKSEIQTAQKKKKTKGRVDKFEKGGKATMPCNKPQKSTRDGKRKMVKACKDGEEKLIHYGDSNLGAHPEDPKRKKSFRSRHKCDTNPPDKMSARYWSCKDW